MNLQDIVEGTFLTPVKIFQNVSLHLFKRFKKSNSFFLTERRESWRKTKALLNTPATLSINYRPDAGLSRAGAG